MEEDPLGEVVQVEAGSLGSRHRETLSDAVFRVSLKTQAVFFRQLATLIEAGVTTPKAVDTLLLQSGSSRLTRILREIRPVIIEGSTLSQALGKYPHIFSDFQVNLIRAGEAGGSLEVRLRDLADYLEKAYIFQQKIISQFIYPLIIVHAGVFLPPVAIVITEGVAAYLRVTLGFLIPLYLAAAGLFVLSRLLGEVNLVAALLDSLTVKLPMVRKLVVALGLMKFFRGFANLYEAGVSMAPAVTLSAGACGNRKIKELLLTATGHLDAGRSFTSSMKEVKVMPPIALQMLGAGEESGNLGGISGKIAEYMEIEVTEALNRISVVLPVLLYLLVGAYVGYKIISFYVGYFNRILNVQ